MINHGRIERNSILMLVLILIVVSIGGLIEIAPLFWLESTIEKVKGVRPYTPLELAGRNVYIREGCYVCHSQMVRSLRDARGGWRQSSIQSRSNGRRCALLSQGARGGSCLIALVCPVTTSLSLYCASPEGDQGPLRATNSLSRGFACPMAGSPLRREV